MLRSIRFLVFKPSPNVHRRMAECVEQSLDDFPDECGAGEGKAYNVHLNYALGALGA